MATKKIKVGIIGLGMVGEPLKNWFVNVLGYKRGKDLFCYDTDPKKGYFDDINKADIIFVTLPTPSNPDESCNTSIVEGAVKTIKDGKIVVVKSTVEPGTVARLQKKHPRKYFIFNPEFLTEAQAWLDFVKPDRQLVAPTSKSQKNAWEVLSLLPLAPFVRPWSSDYTKKRISSTEAEMAKYASNVFGYIKVIYGNILADICCALKLKFKKDKIPEAINYENIREAISADPRIGPAWLNVEHGDYAGVGGFCFPKDMKAFMKFIEKLIEDLSKIKKVDQGLIKSLKAGLKVLKSVEDYNKTLLAWQGLRLSDVSKHNKEIIIKKRKPVRNS